MNKKELKRINLVKYIKVLREKGFNPIVQEKCWFHYKDGAWNFFPTTGTYYNDDTHEKGIIEDLPSKKDISIKKKNRYYNLDKRYLPDWIFDEKRQQFLKDFFATKNPE